MLGTPVRFDYTGAVQTYTVPANVIGLQVDCIGAAGHTNGGTTEYPVVNGKGGRVQCKLTVLSGQILNIYVGGNNGYNGGGTDSRYGNGGGASDIRIGGTALTDRKVVAGGGGTGIQALGIGGNGGGLIGQDGEEMEGMPGYNGKGGTQTAGGASAHCYAGSFGQGGNGYYSAPAGGGWYGGGAGGQDGVYGIIAGGAGGGSSYTDPDLCTDVVHTQGYSEATGNGWIILTPIYPDAYERDPSADKAVIMHSKTYNAFTAAGYDEIGTLHGVYLKNIPDEYAIQDAEYITTFEDQVGNLANKAHLMQYIGSKAIVDVPIGKKQG